MTAEVASDHVWYPERIAVTTDGGRGAYVVPPTAAGATGQAGIWICATADPDGPAEANGPRLLSPDLPVTNLSFKPGGDAEPTLLAYGTAAGHHSVLVLREVDGEDSEVGGDVRTFDLPGVIEWIDWEDAGTVLVLLAEPGADTASLSSGKPLTAEATDTPAAAGAGTSAAAGAGTLPAPIVRSNRLLVGWRRVWRVWPVTGEVSPVTPDDLTVWEFAPLGDGRLVAVCAADPSEAGWYRSRLSILGPAPEHRHELHGPDWPISSPTVSPDGGAVAFLEGWTSDRGLGTGEVQTLDLATGSLRPTAGGGSGGEDSIDVTWLRWMPDGRLWFAGWRGLGMAWGWTDLGPAASTTVVGSARAGITNSRWRPQVVPLDGGRAMAVRSAPQEPPEVCLLSASGAVAPLSTLNAGVERDRGFTVEEVRWTTEGIDLEGLLAVPVNGAGPTPLVVDIHGGPSVSYHHSWDVSWAETLTRHGYAVFLPNPHGGPGRGQGFARQNLGDPAGSEIRQIVSGVAFLAASNRADASRVAAMGASYGGYLTAWAAALGTQLNGGVVIAGMSDLQSCWATANNAPFYEFLCLGTPGEQHALYADRSPVNRVSAGSAPVLILHGELDQCVPVTQARELFATMTAAGVDAELVVYPGEGHQVQQLGYRRDQRERIGRFLADVFSS